MMNNESNDEKLILKRLINKNLIKNKTNIHYNQIFVLPKVNPSKGKDLFTLLRLKMGRNPLFNRIEEILKEYSLLNDKSNLRNRVILMAYIGQSLDAANIILNSKNDNKLEILGEIYQISNLNKGIYKQRVDKYYYFKTLYINAKILKLPKAIIEELRSIKLRRRN